MSKCTDCNEYNQEKHYCPKFCDVIRDTTKEMQEFYKDEHEKLEKIRQILNASSYIENGVTYSYCYDNDSRLKHIKEVLERE